MSARYYDYQGAFRCLQEDAGDVAFIKHSTIPDFAAGGKSAEAWAKDSPAEFRLICPGGGCRPLEDFQMCYTAKVSSSCLCLSCGFLRFFSIMSSHVFAYNCPSCTVYVAYQVPAHAVVAPESFLPTGENAALGKAIQDALVGASLSDGFLESTVQLNGQKNFIFKSGTVGLDAVTTSFEETLGPQTVLEYRSKYSIIASSVEDLSPDF